MRRRSDLRSYLLLVGRRSENPYAGSRSRRAVARFNTQAVRKKLEKRESNSVMRLDRGKADKGLFSWAFVF
jgi:hypothetical protein